MTTPKDFARAYPAGYKFGLGYSECASGLRMLAEDVQIARLVPQFISLQQTGPADDFHMSEWTLRFRAVENHGLIPSKHDIDEEVAKMKRRDDVLQRWRDNCHCGCDACVAMIETLGLEHSVESEKGTG